MSKEMWLYLLFMIWLSGSVGDSLWVYDMYKHYKQDVTLKHLFIIIFAPIMIICDFTDKLLFKLSTYTIIKYINRKEK